MMICVTLSIFKAFMHECSWCTMQWCFMKCDCIVFHYFTSPSLLPALPGAPSVTVPDMMTADKEHSLNIFFTASCKSLDLVVSLNGTEEAISSVAFYSSSVPLIKMAAWAVSAASGLSSIAKVYSLKVAGLLSKLLPIDFPVSSVPLATVWWDKLILEISPLFSGQIISATVSILCLINSPSVNGFNFFAINYATM